MSIIIGIATTGRPHIVIRTLAHLALQTRTPDRIIVCIARDGDLDRAALGRLSFPVEVLEAPRGLTRQRNAILDRARREDLVVFLDDDFLPAADFCAKAEALFNGRADVVMATGKVLLDGIIGPGISFEEAENRLALPPVRTKDQSTPVYNGYGCNMVIRARPVVDNGLRFDESLPLYGWLEDVDFSRQLARHGQIVQAPALQGVHLGSKSWRTPGVRLGYSQIANPLYLMSKGTMIWWRALYILTRNLVMNLLRFPRPEPWVDRRGRLRGNMLALRDLVKGHLRPERAAELE